MESYGGVLGTPSVLFQQSSALAKMDIHLLNGSEDTIPL